MSEPEPIDISKVQPGPIRHESLSPEMLDHAKAVFDVIGPYLGMNLERFELNLMRDSDPETEFVVWVSITAAWIAYHDKHLGGEYLSDEEEKNLINALIIISTGATEVAKFGVPEDVGQKLLDCYDELGGE